MGCVGGVVAATLFAVGSLLCVADARSDELANPYPDLITVHSPASELDVRPAEVGNLHHLNRYMLFAGFDLWRNGGFAHGGMLWSPGGIEREGFTLKLLVAGGVYRYHVTRQLTSGRTPAFIRQEIVGAQDLVSVMAGWRVKFNGLEATIYLGPDLQYHVLVPDDLNNSMRGINMGLRGGIDVWYQPWSQFMLNAGVSASTIGNNYWGRAAAGWYLAGIAWVGPEVLALGGGVYSQLRFGAHVTGLRFGGIDWSVGAGHVQDSDHRNGFYARFGIVGRL
jgi:hypothetical protein